VSENLKIWNQCKQPPKSALKRIVAGRLKGKTDINPQWRYQVMTEIFGPCGVGWKYEIVRVWYEEGSDKQVFAFAEVHVYIRENGEWSDPIPGVGGSMLVTAERSGLHSSDEGYKMAVTDALSTALKMLGVAADIYAGAWDGTKYITKEVKDKPISNEQVSTLAQLITETDTDSEVFCNHFGIDVPSNLPASRFAEAVWGLEAKKQRMANAE